MELPVEILHSMIGRLVINVPWNKLSSSPVEVLIEDVLLVVVPKDPRVE
jgi:vacuolar protein sorting-associated protein 13A/C